MCISQKIFKATLHTLQQIWRPLISTESILRCSHINWAQLQKTPNHFNKPPIDTITKAARVHKDRTKLARDDGITKIVTSPYLDNTL